MSQSSKVERAKKAIRSAEFKQFFANGFRMRVGDNDIGLTFTFETDDADGTLFFLDQAQAVMTPKTFKILALSVQKLLTMLESNMGEIRLAPEQVAAIEAMQVKNQD